ncbi:MAG: AAA family ATPase [Chloroflexi bacterium]|nr:AAA family ATPase [Chloroflexota bacterium]
MKYIQKIEINHFRSINKLVIDNLSDINVLSGLNDVGKSNVIKVLNLFFNNQVDWQTALDFERDTNTFHTYYSKNAHMRKHISVKLTFRRPPKRYASLPEYFWIEMSWDKDTLLQPLRTWGDSRGPITNSRKTSSISKFLKRCKFFYVPAIRGPEYYRHLIRDLAKSIVNVPNEKLTLANRELSTTLANSSAILISNLKQVTDLDIELQMPSSMLTVLEAASFHTQGDIPLRMRGDGIQSMIVPAILSYMSKESRTDFYFWAFEEPENSLEYIKTTQLADRLRSHYSSDAQIFLTTHSPAFLAMRDEQTSIFRVFKRMGRYERTGYEELVTDIDVSCIDESDADNPSLVDELGVYQIVRKFDTQMRLALREKDENNKRLQDEIRRLREPTLLVEGKFDKSILEEAWQRLYGVSMPFSIVDAGGASKLPPRILAWIDINHNLMCALFDYDQEGLKGFDNVKNNRKHAVRDNSRGLFKQLTIGDNVMCLTLPIPPFYNRKPNAENHNLEIEWYFSDARLNEIDKMDINGLFSKTSYLNKKNSKGPIQVGETELETLLENNHIDTRHRKLIDTGKPYLVNALNLFDDVDFRNFHSLFVTVVKHLVPRLELELKDDLRGKLLI